MEKNNTHLISIWGSWWQPIRKWFYPIWLAYETSIRFNEYAIATHQYLEEISTTALAITGGVLAFIICSLFLTVPACFVLYKFFRVENLTETSFEKTTKKYF